MTENSQAMLLKIAIPAVDGRLLGHFGESRHFALVEAGRQSRAIVRTQFIETPPHEPGSLPRWLREQGVQVVIAANIGQRALDNLVYHDIEVWIGQPGAPVNNLVAGYLGGHMPRMLSGCDQQHGPKTQARECQLAGYLEKQSARETDSGG